MAFNSVRAARILTEQGWLEQGEICLDEQGKIVAIQPCSGPVADVTVLPALIDTHIHGGAGADVMDGTHAALNQISCHLAKHGVGAFLATTVTAADDHIKQALAQVKQSQQQGVDGAMLLGSYLEGPFFTAKHKGAHPETLLHAPQQAKLAEWIAIAEGSLRCVALAPEYPESLALIPWLKQQGIRVMLGHSAATYAQVRQALLAGADGVVHCYNGMNGLHHRQPGMVGAAFTSDHCQVELIVDGHHVHPAAVNVARRCCGDRLLLISDAMRATGMPDGEYLLGELMVHMRDGIVRTDSGSLAGSTLTLENAVSKFAAACEINFTQAWLHGSSIPARALGLADQLGSLAAGKWANLVLMDANQQLLATMVQGQWVYQHSDFQATEAVCISSQAK